MTDIAHLLPCPFCGGRPQIDETEDGGSFIECAKCGAASAVHYDRMENLIPSWNRRALEADNVRLREALLEIIRKARGEFEDSFVMAEIARAALEGK